MLQLRNKSKNGRHFLSNYGTNKNVPINNILRKILNNFIYLRIVNMIEVFLVCMIR